ncbi:MAG: glycosyltransferase family 2 protein [Flavobacterium sp.]|nr:glycosyltransferase family 2 protein [Pedobacter sp.]
MKASLIISTYNWTEALNLCLQSVIQQSRLPDEIIIADDGSDNNTRELLKNFQSKTKIPLKHVWHPDQGFQLSVIRNKAILVAAHEYIIQIDGDLILHADFVKDHLVLATKGKFVSGSRLLLPPNFTTKLLHQQKIPSNQTLLLAGDNRLNGIRIPFLTKHLSPIYKKNKPFYVKGCNMAFWRDDLFIVNGYNEKISGWGKEDSELAIRLINYGVNRLFIKFGGICYHLFHREASRNREGLNDSILNETLRTHKVRCEKGIDSHSLDEIIVFSNS